MHNPKHVYDIAAEEIKQLQDIRCTLHKWNIGYSATDGFIGQYLRTLHELAKTFLFKSLNMTYNFVTLNPNNTSGYRTVLAMVGSNVAISMGNVEWFIMNGKDFETLWKALHDLDAEAIEEIDKGLLYETGNITNFPIKQIVSLASRELSEKDLYAQVVDAIALHQKITNELQEAGLLIDYEHGAFGRHHIFVEKFFTACLLTLLHLKECQCVDETTWASPITFTVYYPVDENLPIDISTLDEDFDKLKDAISDAEVARNIWVAYVETDASAVEWLNTNTKAHVGPAKENDNG